MEKTKWKQLAVSLLISLGTGVISSLFAWNSMGKYKTMYKPPLAPPGWIFPVVWTILFILMGIAAWLVYRSDSPEKKQALKIYLIQLAVNAVWPVIFFRFEAYLTAMAWLLLLWYLVFMTMRLFYNIDPKSGRLMAPYLIWLTFAGYLNLAIALHYL